MAKAGNPQDAHAQQLAALERQLVAAQRLRHVMLARDNLLDFATLSMPDPEFPDDPTKTRFQIAPHHVLLAEALRRVRDGTVSRLAISMPPRHTKSELASRLFPAWCIGANPYWQIILAGATAEFAKEEFGRKIRSYMETPTYQQVFPGASLRGGSRAVDAITTREGGNIKSIGKGGQVVGRGADCVSGDTLVQTEIGPIRMDILYGMECPPRVLSFRHGDRQLSYNRIQATRRIEDREVWKLATDGGRTVVGTADHRVYSRSRGYVRLCDLQPGEQLVVFAAEDQEARHKTPGPIGVVRDAMRSMWRAIRPSRVRGQEGGASRALGHLLRHGLFAGSSRHEKFEGVRSVRRSGTEVKAHWSADGTSVLRAVSSLASAFGKAVRKEIMSAMRGMVLADQEPQSLLLAGVFECSALGADGWNRKLEVQGRNVLREVVSGDEAADPGAGRIQVRRVRYAARDNDGRNRKETKYPSRPSHRRESCEQRAGESCDAVQALSSLSPQEDTVRVVERVRGVRIPVYDIQVEGDHNFFAGEVLVHNCFVIDDPYSGREEAHSPTERKKVWDWFTSDVISRMMPGGRIVVIHQRWHEDDLIGRLTDPTHPEHNPKVSGKWMHLYLPAIVYDHELARLLGIELTVPENPEHREMFGDRPSRPLWPERYGYDFFAEVKSQNASSFEALYMGNPTPDDGEFFKREHIVPRMYAPNELPRNLRYYVASDHAVSTDQDRDPSCFIVGGVDEEGTLWIVDCVWRRMETDVAVESMLETNAIYHPLIWWAEKGHISKSIGPFLRKRMSETGNYINVHEVTPAKDKMTRAQAIQARIAMGKVRFPMHAPWMQAALDEMLKFPMARHDDFVDALAHLGGGLARQTTATQPKPKPQWPRTGTLAWVKFADRQRRKLEDQRLSKYR